MKKQPRPTSLLCAWASGMAGLDLGQPLFLVLAQTSVMVRVRPGRSSFLALAGSLSFHISLLNSGSGFDSALFQFMFLSMQIFILSFSLDLFG